MYLTQVQANTLNPIIVSRNLFSTELLIFILEKGEINVDLDYLYHSI